MALYSRLCVSLDALARSSLAEIARLLAVSTPHREGCALRRLSEISPPQSAQYPYAPLASRASASCVPRSAVTLISRTAMPMSCCRSASAVSATHPETRQYPVGNISAAGLVCIRENNNPRLRVEVCGDTLMATGSLVVRHTDFGLTPVSVAGVV
ncbi:MAG: hypothetical protein DMF81_09415, partial [Acidobacteria bacterium]